MWTETRRPLVGRIGSLFPSEAFRFLQRWSATSGRGGSSFSNARMSKRQSIPHSSVYYLFLFEYLSCCLVSVSAFIGCWGLF